jgi:hypothetical protein
MKLTNFNTGEVVEFWEFLDGISDAPKDPLAYVRYALDGLRARREDWSGPVNHERMAEEGEAIYRAKVETAVFWIDSAIFSLEGVERRLVKAQS